MRARPVHRFRSAMMNVHARTGTKGNSFRPSSIETAVDQSQMRYTPGIAVSAAVSAVRSCREAKLEGKELESCIERSTSPGAVIVGAVVPSPAGAPQGSE
jgi:hypothetical protein